METCKGDYMEGMRRALFSPMVGGVHAATASQRQCGNAYPSDKGTDCDDKCQIMDVCERVCILFLSALLALAGQKQPNHQPSTGD